MKTDWLLLCCVHIYDPTPKSVKGVELTYYVSMICTQRQRVLKGVILAYYVSMICTKKDIAACYSAAYESSLSCANACMLC